MFFSASKESINIVELDPHKGFGIVKPYTSPNLTCASVIKLDGNNLLYIGGTKVHHDGLIIMVHQTKYICGKRKRRITNGCKCCT